MIPKKHCKIILQSCSKPKVEKFYSRTADSRDRVIPNKLVIHNSVYTYLKIIVEQTVQKTYSHQHITFTYIKTTFPLILVTYFETRQKKPKMIAK